MKLIDPVGGFQSRLHGEVEAEKDKVCSGNETGNNCFIVCLKFFIVLHNDSVARQTLLLQTLSHHTATFILTYTGIRFSSFPDNVQYLSACNIENIAQLHHIDLYGNTF